MHLHLILCVYFLRSPPIFSGVCVTRSLVLCVCFVDRYLSFCLFSFGHCVVCSFSIYWFWLPLLMIFINMSFLKLKTTYSKSTRLQHNMHLHLILCVYFIHYIRFMCVFIHLHMIFVFLYIYIWFFVRFLHIYIWFFGCDSLTICFLMYVFVHVLSLWDACLLFSDHIQKPKQPHRWRK
jgi:hypothetical protein